jgi:hypothetical protein
MHESLPTDRSTEHSSATPEGRCGTADRANFVSEFTNLITQFAEAKLAGDDRGALSKALGALALAAEEAEQNPPPDQLLMREAADREAHADWDGAEHLRREILALLSAGGNEGCIAKAHLELSELFQLRGRLDAAWESALAASAGARRFGVSMLTALMLRNEACCALLRDDVDAAARAIDEALAGLETTRLTQGMRGRLWVSRARCLSARQDLLGAEAALAEARHLMDEEKSPTCCPGIIATEAEYREVQAVILAAHNDSDGAVKAWEEAVGNRRVIAETMRPGNPHAVTALAKALECLGRGLAAIGRAHEATSVEEEALKLRHRVDAGLARLGWGAECRVEEARSVLHGDGGVARATETQGAIAAHGH